MPKRWGAKNKTHPGILLMKFYWTGQHFTNGLNMFYHRSHWIYSNNYITAVANNSTLQLPLQIL